MCCEDRYYEKQAMMHVIIATLLPFELMPGRYSKESGHSGLLAFFCVQQSAGWQPGNTRLTNWDW